jgi:hypothetical protein
MNPVKTYLINILGYELAAGVGPASTKELLWCPCCLVAVFLQLTIKGIWRAAFLLGLGAAIRLSSDRLCNFKGRIENTDFWWRRRIAMHKLLDLWCFEQDNSLEKAAETHDYWPSSPPTNWDPSFPFPRCLGNRAKHTYTYV